MGIKTAERQLLFSLSKDRGDFVVTPYRGSGKGGQKRNKTFSGCRVTHPTTGLFVECEEERSYETNKKRAFERLVNKPEFMAWLKVETARHKGKFRDLEEKGNREMSNIRIDVKDEKGRWVPESLPKVSCSCVIRKDSII
jgi:protein subunit release factor B